jgi:hypothetical protein
LSACSSLCQTTLGSVHLFLSLSKLLSFSLSVHLSPAS